MNYTQIECNDETIYAYDVNQNKLGWNIMTGMPVEIKNKYSALAAALDNLEDFDLDLGIMEPLNAIALPVRPGLRRQNATMDPHDINAQNQIPAYMET